MGLMYATGRGCDVDVVAAHKWLNIAAIKGCERAAELRAEWFEGKSRVGLTAGASAPEILVREVIDRIRALGAVSVRKMDGIEETIKFPLPKGLKIDAATGLEIRERMPETGPSAH